MMMPGRKFSFGNSYRYGFNGKEKDKDITSDDYDFGGRIYDGRIGRWLSTDPRQEKYSNLSPYNAMANNPLLFTDPDGNTIIISAHSKRVLLSTANNLALLFLAQKGKDQITRLHNESNKIYIIKAIDGVKTEYSPSKKTLEFDPNETITDKKGYIESSLFTLGHELDHMDRDEKGKTSLTLGYEEGMAVNASNYYRSVGGFKKFQTSYDFGIWDNHFSDEPDRFAYMLENNPNPAGEKVKITAIKTLSSVKLDTKGEYTISMQTYDADAKEVKEAKKGTIYFYDYQKDKNSKVEKKAMIQTIEVLNNEKN